jgi:hypothetical protein
MKVDFIPKRDGDLDGHEANFIQKLQLYAAALGLNPAEVNETINIITEHMQAHANSNSQRAISKSASEESRLKKKAAKKEMRRIAKLIKASKTYSTAIGMDLQIIGSESIPKNMTDIKPDLKLNITGQKVGISFRKDNALGINIYSRRGAETEFTLLVSNTEVNYTDDRAKLESAKPEQREYYAYYTDDNIQTGIRSEIHSAIVP